MFRLLAPLLVFGVLLAAGATAASSQAPDIPAITIAEGDLRFPVTVAPADADAFVRRINQLPRLEEDPEVTGTPYRVTSSYWSTAVTLEEDEEELDVDVRGDYYQDGGYVRLTLGEDEDADDVWVVINLRQRAILDRYIRLVNAGLIGEEPSTMQVITTAAASGETITLEAGGERLPAETAAELTAGLAGAPMASLDPPEPPSGEGTGFWLTVTFLEGHAARYFYDGATLTEGLGTERYETAGVAALFSEITPSTLPVIAEQEPAGSRWWWVVMVGGGLVAIGVAMFIQRRLGGSR